MFAMTMSIKGIIYFTGIIFILAVSITSGPGCANIVPPQGGARDSLAPLLVKANPGDSTLNFTGNKIGFTFNEFVNLQNIQENLLVSPTPKILPIVDYKLNTVSVKIRDTLEANTTYSLNFGNAIKDVNEGNIIKGFTYTFSTGKYLDSLEFRGKVLIAETGKPDSTLVVLLHTNSEDSVVIKEKPRYIARLDSQGNFHFRHLPPATFYVYALKDDGGTHRYLSEKQLFAFADSPVAIQSNNRPLTLYAWTPPNLPVATTPSTSRSGLLGRRGPGGIVEKRLKYTTNLINSQQDLTGEFIMSFDQPLQSFDSSKLSLYTDSSFIPVSAYSINRDTSARKLVLTTPWKENTLYHLIMDKDFASDTSGKKLLKTDTLSFKTKKVSEYGVLKMTLRNLDISKNPVLIFIFNASVFKSFPLSGGYFSQSLFFPGEYELRILYDANKNGKWDPGIFFGKHQQPELVRPITRKIIVKPGGDNEFEIAL